MLCDFNVHQDNDSSRLIYRILVNITVEPYQVDSGSIKGNCSSEFCFGAGVRKLETVLFLVKSSPEAHLS